MKFNKKKYRFIKFIIIAGILLFPSIIQANEIDLKEAIEKKSDTISRH